MTTALEPGARVRVRADGPRAEPGKVHIRTPDYLRGRRGIVDCRLGEFRNPEELAFGRPGLPQRALYRVLFTHAELWPDGASGDSVAADIYEHWLEPETR